jgi:dienelactone hydrolase
MALPNSGLILAAAALWLSCTAAPLQADWAAEVRALRPLPNPSLSAAVLDNLERRASRALEAITHPQSAAEVGRTRPRLRRLLAESLGHKLLPPPRALDARITGTVLGDGYRIEKVVYQSLPGVRVPAHLYLPAKIAGRIPGVLFYPGHWREDSKSRPEFQTFCINLARLGFAVFNFDPIGQGERGVSTRDHRRTESLLVGISHQGFAEHDALCALEYLLSRPEVDPERIGMTGASGGGYNTWITAALDDRIKVAVPVVGSDDFALKIRVHRKFQFSGGRDHCHFPTGLIRFANNHELLAMIAPRPLLVVSATADTHFPIAGVRELARYGGALYGSMGAAEGFGFVEDRVTGHDYARKKREAAYGWFLKWLLGRGDGSPFPETASSTLPYDSPELRCLPPGRNEASGPGMDRAIMRLADEIQVPAARPFLSGSLGALPRMPAERLRLTAERVQRLHVSSEEDLQLPGFLVREERLPRGFVVAAHDRGKETLAEDPVVRRLLAGGWGVVGIDVRGVGELEPSGMGWILGVTLLLGESFVWRQGWDLRVAVESIAAAFPGKPVGLYAAGHNMSLAGMFAFAQLREADRLPAWMALRGGFLSFRSFLHRPLNRPLSYRLLPVDPHGPGGFDREIPMTYFPFNALRHFDLPQLIAGGRARILVVDPIDGDWNVLSIADARAMLTPGVDVLSGASPEKIADRIAGLAQQGL